MTLGGLEFLKPPKAIRRDDPDAASYFLRFGSLLDDACPIVLVIRETPTYYVLVGMEGTDRVADDYVRTWKRARIAIARYARGRHGARSFSP